jgi:hypothetical protein
MKKTALVLVATLLFAGVATLSCQQSTDASAQGKRPAAKSGKSLKSLIVGAPAGSITVLSFPTAQDVYIVPKGHVNPGDSSRFTRQEYFAGRTPLQVARPAVNYYVVVKQSPGDSYETDGEINRLYLFPDKNDLSKMFTDAKVYSIVHDDNKRSFVSSLIWPGSMSPADFMKTLPSEELLVIPDEDLARIKAVFKKNGVSEPDWEGLFTLLRKTGRTAWHGENYKNLSAYYSALGPAGEPKDLGFMPFNAE